MRCERANSVAGGVKSCQGERRGPGLGRVHSPPARDAPRAPAWIEIDANPKVRDSIKLDPWPICEKPDNIVLVVTGGGHPTHSYWLQAHSPTVQGRVIRVPETFDRLVAETDKDLKR